MDTPLYIALLFVVLVVIPNALFLYWAVIRKKEKPPSPHIKERLMKILYNPFEQKHYWVVFNPKRRIWEWDRECLPFEVDNWKDSVIAEWEKKPEKKQ